MDGKPIIQQLEDELNQVIDKYCEEGLVVGEIIGTLELVKLAFYHTQFSEDDI